jgi:hypothetical protein
MITLENRGQKKGIRKKIGHVYRIPLEEGVYTYGQIVNDTNYVFFDYKDDGVNTDISKILASKVLFKITVDRYIFSKGYWEIIGTYPVDSLLTSYDNKFIYDSFKKQYTIFKDGIGQIPATWEEIKDLECLASWGCFWVEQRLKDHFAGRPNFAVESFRNEHDPSFEKDAIKFYKNYGYDFKLPDED